MRKVTICILLVMAALMAAGCGKFHSCVCAEYTAWDIVDTALADSVQAYPVSTYVSTRESAIECSYWTKRDSVGQYLPESGIRVYYILDCGEE